jgi:spore coat protein A
MLTRRQLLKTTAATGAALSFPWGIRSAYPFAQSPTTIPLFGTTLRGIGTIGVAAPDAFLAPVTGVTHYTINIDQFQDQICPSSSGLGPTTLRGFNPTVLLAGQSHKHLGGIIVGQKGVPIQITFRNNLPGGMHIIPNDLTIPHANEGNNRTAVHLHGGLVPWISDGGPFSWWDPTGAHGPSFLNNQVLRSPGTAAANEAEYYYPLNQSARFVWYHDHAIGITRINAYAGIASALFIRDNFEANLLNSGLPDLSNTVATIFRSSSRTRSSSGRISPSSIRPGRPSLPQRPQAACGTRMSTSALAGGRPAI